MRILNATPHPIDVVLEEGGRITLPPSGVVLRLVEEDEPQGEVAGVPLRRRQFKLPQLPPELADADIVVVSLPFLMGMAASGLLPSRPLFVAPDTGRDAIRDEQGRIIAVRAFITM